MISLELKEKVNQVINNSMSVGELEEWLVPRLPALITPPNFVDSEVVAAIELGFAEMADHIRTEEEFIKFLEDVLNEQLTTFISYSTGASETYDVSVSGSSNQTITPQLIFTTPALAQL